ncbi:PH domain-containing protein [Alteromonas sediminis]|uniref:PH domain-containing protein n=1 Tax=Alteromonas sediminis TaxID=2259342 RepID=A0A3N5Y1L7_9ALTE|nr:PH domain-containing protein [Alteromonas sediminis]RPJ66426.1 PH domain-containing protein [Alteromonas sediminis]
MKERILLTAEFNPSVKTYWVLMVVIVSGFTVIGIPLLIVTLPLAFFISGRVLKAMSANLYERKLVVKRGVFNKVEKSIPLEKITDVALIQGPIMRAFDLQQLSFETAGQSGEGALVSLLGIKDAEMFRETILQQKDALLSVSSPVVSDSTNRDGDIVALTESVHRIEQLLQKLVEHKTAK